MTIYICNNASCGIYRSLMPFRYCSTCGHENMVFAEKQAGKDGEGDE